MARAIVTPEVAVEAIKLTRTRIRNAAFNKTQNAIQNWDGESILRVGYTSAENTHAIEEIIKEYKNAGWDVSTNNYQDIFQLVFTLPWEARKSL